MFYSLGLSRLKMYRGYWYDVAGKERTDLRPLTLDFDSLQRALDEVLHVMPDANLVTMSLNLDWGLISIEDNKRMLVCRS